MNTFLHRMRGSGQTRPEGGAHAALGPARPAGAGVGVIMVAAAPVPLLNPDTTVATATLGSTS